MSCRIYRSPRTKKPGGYSTTRRHTKLDKGRRTRCETMEALQQTRRRKQPEMGWQVGRVVTLMTLGGQLEKSRPGELEGRENGNGTLQFSGGAGDRFDGMICTGHAACNRRHRLQQGGDIRPDAEGGDRPLDFCRCEPHQKSPPTLQPPFHQRSRDRATRVAPAAGLRRLANRS